ncbi:hypothetical protein C9374_001805 [Naegleria lovaniensis]|uniref:Protein kinase domain-containing protein n=1 Tax=Naegleria lovaniensis TaxID=51637 RepID=A0AA88KMD9_NAELO|nr:uncharacterized protein C9374_001805 [Naegleria lovaniensis]KAG2387473.1 hypothetical protein C9374_001805 [Naegleria lovaniensis]
MSWIYSLTSYFGRPLENVAKDIEKDVKMSARNIFAADPSICHCVPLAKTFMSEVFIIFRRNNDSDLFTTSVMKIVFKDNVPSRSSCRDLLIREASNHEQASESNIAKCLNVFEKDNFWLIEMKFYGLGSLRDLSFNTDQKRPLTTEMAITVLHQITKALDFIQILPYDKRDTLLLPIVADGRYIHRDIKPENILVQKYDKDNDEIEVVLTDFGLCRSLNSVEEDNGGTDGYRAPEKKITIRSDFFSLGTSLLEMWNETNDEQGRKLKAFLSIMTKENPDDRPQSTNEILQFCELFQNPDQTIRIEQKELTVTSYSKQSTSNNCEQVNSNNGSLKRKIENLRATMKNKEAKKKKK